MIDLFSYLNNFVNITDVLNVTDENSYVQQKLPYLAGGQDIRTDFENAVIRPVFHR